MSNLDRLSRSDEAATARSTDLNRSFRTWVPALLLPVVLAFGACGGKSGITTTGSGGSSAQAGTTGTAGGAATAGTTGAGGGTGGAGTGNGGSTGAAGVVGANMATCASYCTGIMAACTGVNQQYSDTANCMKVCSYIAGGTAADTGVNTIGCRSGYIPMVAADTMAVKSECFSAGPLTYGACGEDTDAFCNIVSSYCPGAYTSVDDCNMLTGSQTRTIPGTDPPVDLYGAMWTGADTKDTFECRAYYLVFKALQSTADQATYCPDVANKSTTCGMGYVPPAVPDGGSGDASAVKYDGGNIINSSNWNETTLYPPAKRKMLLRDEGDPHLAIVDLSLPTPLVWKTVAEGPWARAAQLIGNNQILGGTSTGYQVFDYTTGKIVKTVTGFGNTQSAYRMATGETMLTQSGCVLNFLDKNDKSAHQISYPGHGYVRVARPTRNGTFLVPNDTTVFEGDATGKVLWSLANGASGWGHIWEPLLLGPPVGGGTWNDGDTILCTAFGSSCDVIDKTTHKVTFRWGTKTMPMAATFKPNFFSEFEILPNGNIFTANWQGHGAGNGGSGIQVIEFDPKGNVSWFWKQDPASFSSIQGVQSLDGKDPMKLYVQETSTDSTWQPMTPP